MKAYSLAVIPGDGIGPEVTDVALGAMQAAADKHGFSLKIKSFPFGAKYYLEHGEALPEAALGELADFDAMLLGAVGDPRVAPGILEQGILLKLRFYFDQYVNLRPALSFPGVPLPVKLPDGERLNAVVVRENTEDLYMCMGGRGVGKISTKLEAERGLYSLSASFEAELSQGVEAAFSLGLMSRPAIVRIVRYAFSLARERGEKAVHVITKANAVPHLYGFWDEVVREVAAGEFPDMQCVFTNVDAACYKLARSPGGWGVVLCPNLFGDIVSDLLSGLAGGLGLAAAGNIGDSLSMFEPVHGSAPDIAGTGTANPIAAILSGAMLFKHLGETDAAMAMEQAVTTYLATGGANLPYELCGKAGTREVGELIKELV